ncbi:MAG: DHA2 family efflux MFS transporter permease subunit [Pseudomonadota bacterium]|jgi:DHA2 family multidrug resistance protein
MKDALIPKPLEGPLLLIAALLLAFANFIVVLDMTVANVSVSDIAGGLAVSLSEGTYVITSYAVAEAVSVPLTGWLAMRFGTVRVFTLCMLLFGVFSALCGFADSLSMLVSGRVLQGLAGGPLMPLSQTLLMQIFPKEKKSAALGIWAMTTLVAPVLGPVVGGYICDNWGWGFIFFINIPLAIVCSLVLMNILKPYESTIFKHKVDFIGLGLLIVWVAALQIMLDEGKNYDWFGSHFIWGLFIVFLIGFACFLIWELTHSHPIVDLRVFRHRGYSISVLTLCLAFGAFNCSIVLTPLWLQNFMGYTAGWSGFTTAALGIFAVCAAPIAANLTTKYDHRILVFCGVGWLGLLTLYRSFGSTDMTQLQVTLPMLFQGAGMPFFFVPLTALALASVKPEEMASAAGLMSFVRTLAGALATSVITTAWEDHTNVLRHDFVDKLNVPDIAALQSPVLDAAVPLQMLDRALQDQAVMLATNHLFMIVALTFIFAASAIWLAPKAQQKVDASATH